MILEMFANRKEAGQILAQKLNAYQNENPFVLAIPRGGVVVGRIVAEELGCPIDIVVTRKISAPGQEELALGAVDRDGQVNLDEDLILALNVSRTYLQEAIVKQKEEIHRREQMFRGGRSLPNLEGKTVIIVDDGLATGATALSAIGWVKRQQLRSIVLAIPVAPVDSINKLASKVDNIVVLITPEMFHSVGQFYREFGQVSDEEVKEALNSEPER